MAKAEAARAGHTRPAAEGNGGAGWREVSPTGAELRFEDFLSFKLGRLYSLIQREVTSRYLEPSGLTHPEWRLLARLSAFPALEMRELTRINLMDKAAISRAVDSMIEKGFVDRRIDPLHAKRRIIAVTAAGRRMLRKVFPAAQKEQAALLRLLSTEERLVLDRALVRLTDTLLQAAGKGEGEPAKPAAPLARRAPRASKPVVPPAVAARSRAPAARKLRAVDLG